MPLRRTVFWRPAGHGLGSGRCWGHSNRELTAGMLPAEVVHRAHTGQGVTGGKGPTVGADQLDLNAQSLPQMLHHGARRPHRFGAGAVHASRIVWLQWRRRAGRVSPPYPLPGPFIHICSCSSGSSDPAGSQSPGDPSSLLSPCPIPILPRVIASARLQLAEMVGSLYTCALGRHSFSPTPCCAQSTVRHCTRHHPMPPTQPYPCQPNLFPVHRGRAEGSLQQWNPGVPCHG